MSEMNKVDESQRMTVDQSGNNWQYPSAAESGHVEIELPTLPGSLNPTERLHARDFGVLVAGKVENSMRGTYLKSGPQQGPVATFKHYVAVAKGSELMDSAAIGRMEMLATEFAETPEREEYFSQVLKPYLHGLKPGKRRKP